MVHLKTGRSLEVDVRLFRVEYPRMGLAKEPVMRVLFCQAKSFGIIFQVQWESMESQKQGMV